MGRIYGKILKRKLENCIRNQIGGKQAGFTVGKSCIDHISTIQQAIQKKEQIIKRHILHL